MSSKSKVGLALIIAIVVFFAFSVTAFGQSFLGMTFGWEQMCINAPYNPNCLCVDGMIKVQSNQIQGSNQVQYEILPRYICIQEELPSTGNEILDHCWNLLMIAEPTECVNINFACDGPNDSLTWFIGDTVGRQVQFVECMTVIDPNTGTKREIYRCAYWLDTGEIYDPLGDDRFMHC